MTGINTQTFSAGQGAHGQGEQYSVLKSGLYEIAEKWLGKFEQGGKWKDLLI